MNMANLKAVIPVAGLGMHMLPATKAIPKEMLPIVDKPMIQYIVDEIVAAGIKEIVLVTHSSKNAVENHFDTSYELEALLEQRVKRQLLAEVQAICPPGVTIMNVRQAQPLGLGHSILCARPVVGDNPFVVVLPDIILDGGTADPLRYNLAAMIARFNETGRSQVLAKRMPGDLSEYSVIQTKEPMVAEGQVARIVEFIEKRAVGGYLGRTGTYRTGRMGPYPTDRRHCRTGEEAVRRRDADDRRKLRLREENGLHAGLRHLRDA